MHRLLWILMAGTLSTTAADWPQLLGPSRNGVSTETNLAARWPNSGPRSVWRAEAGSGWSGPVVADGKAILFHRRKDREIIEAFDARNGDRRWHYEYPTGYQDDFGFDDGPRATPTVSGGRVYTFGAEGWLQCVNLADGKPVWSVDTKVQFSADKGHFGLACSPLVEGELVLLNLGGQDGAGIAAFDRLTGKLRWKATSDGASYSSPVAATLLNRRLALFVTRGRFLAVEAATGQVRSALDFRPSISASVSAAVPLVVGDECFITASYGAGARLLHYAEPAPEVVWQGDEMISSHYSSCVVHDGNIFGIDGRQEQGGRLRCVDWKSGKVQWTEEGFGTASLTLVNEHLLLLTEKGELVLAPASARGFKAAARAQVLGSKLRAYPALADGLFYARDLKQLVCLDLRSTKPEAKP